MREAIIYAVAMGLLALAGGDGGDPMPLAGRDAPCLMSCGDGPITKF